MKQSHIREWEENNCRLEVGTYSKKKKQEKLKTLKDTEQRRKL